MEIGLISVGIYQSNDLVYLSLREREEEQEESLDLPVEREPAVFYGVRAGGLQNPRLCRWEIDT